MTDEDYTRMTSIHLCSLLIAMIKHITKGTVGERARFGLHSTGICHSQKDIIGKESIGGRDRKLANHRE